MSDQEVEELEILNDERIMEAIRIYDLRKAHGTVKTLSNDEVRKALGVWDEFIGMFKDDPDAAEAEKIR